MRCLAALAVAAFASGQGVWERKADYPISATEVSGAAIGGKAYLVCGLTPQGSTNSLYIYDPKYDRWTAGAALPIPGGVDHCNVAAAGGRLYVLGAIRVGSLFVDGNTYEYDPSTDRWRTVGRMNRPRGASGVAAIGGRIYVAGGLDPSRSVADFEVFDTGTLQWTQLPAMPTARDHLTAQAIGGRFYAIAGRAGQEFSVNEEFDPATGQWRTRAPIPTRRGGLGSGTMFNRIQVFGGEGQSGTPELTYRQNEEYDPAANSWRSLASMPTPRHGLYGVTLDDRIFAASGGPRAGANYSAVVEAFYLPPPVAPEIGAMRVINAASGQPVLTPGSLVSLFGARLSQGDRAATSFPLPLAMNAVTVKVNGIAAPLLYVSPGQINFMLPHNTPAGSPLITVNNAGSESASAVVPPDALRLDSAPGIFQLTPEAQGAILIGGTGLVAAAPQDSFSRPARRGEVLEIYCTGLGPVSNQPALRQAASPAPLSRTLGTTLATIGSSRAEVLFSGLAPGLAGVYQVNARIPLDAPASLRVPVTIRVGEQGIVSNTVTVAIVE